MNGWTVYFAHGKESGPWGIKITKLAEMAKLRGVQVESPDYSDTFDPDERVERLLNLCNVDADRLILVGSSMGGYVSTVASEKLKPAGLFLMAPALYIDNYKVKSPTPQSGNVEIIHGWNDDVIPADNSIKFAQQHQCTLHLINEEHTLNASVDEICHLFDLFLHKVMD